MVNRWLLCGRHLDIKRISPFYPPIKRRKITVCLHVYWVYVYWARQSPTHRSLSISLFWSTEIEFSLVEPSSCYLLFEPTGFSIIEENSCPVVSFCDSLLWPEWGKTDGRSKMWSARLSTETVAVATACGSVSWHLCHLFIFNNEPIEATRLNLVGPPPLTVLFLCLSPCSLLWWKWLYFLLV